jgi:hypothetical protein
MASDAEYHAPDAEVVAMTTDTDTPPASRKVTEHAEAALEKART